MERNKHIVVTGKEFNIFLPQNINNHHQLSLIEHKPYAEHFALH